MFYFIKKIPALILLIQDAVKIRGQGAFPAAETGNDMKIPQIQQFRIKTQAGRGPGHFTCGKIAVAVLAWAAGNYEDVTWVHRRLFSG